MRVGYYTSDVGRISKINGNKVRIDYGEEGVFEVQLQLSNYVGDNSARPTKCLEW